MMPHEFGPCVCGADHEHSDFEPYACADCDCPALRPAALQSEESGSEAPAEPPERVGVTVPADALDFSRERVTQAAATLDEILAGHPPITDPDEPDGVCGLADLLEQTWPEGVDPLDVLAIAIRRLIDATSRKRLTAAEAFEHMRRKVRR